MARLTRRSERLAGRNSVVSVAGLIGIQLYEPRRFGRIRAHGGGGRTRRSSRGLVARGFKRIPVKADYNSVKLRHRPGWIWLGIGAALTLSWVLTYFAGGTRSPLPHAFYVPVVLAAGTFGARAGFGVAVLAGVLCGPLMPLNVDTGQDQTMSGWLIRLGFFVVIALVVGVGRNRLLELSQARQKFLSVVSHELRTPLASVMGFASLMADDSADLGEEERREFSKIVLKEATELSNVIDHYVVEGRLSDSALFIDPRPTDLRHIVDVVLSGLPEQVRSERIRVDGRDVVCVADPLRLRQILRSMINNALAYTSGLIEVVVAADRRRARVWVSETNPQVVGGGGLTRVYVKRPAEVAPPLGIGLSVSRELARRMGGDLEYEVNSTSRYELRLPLSRIGVAGRL